MDEPSGRIREFRLPTELNPFVEKLCTLLLNAAHADGIDDDGIGFGGVPEHWRPAYIVYLATATFSEIVEHLHITVALPAMVMSEGTCWMSNSSPA